MVGVDGTADSLHALDEVARNADDTGAALIVLFVRHESALAHTVSNAAIKSALDEVEKKVHDQAVAILGPRRAHWRFDVAEGDPAAELIASATEHRATTIVVGGKGHGLVGGIVTGSVAQKLVRNSPVSVAVIRRTAEAPR